MTIMQVFGPIPSRRLGRSLGINNIPPKACSYSCVYCQIGHVPETEVKPRGFYTPAYLFQQVKQRVEQLKSQGETVDYLSFVPDGEPTLDTQLGETVDLLKVLGIKIAIISNASLIWRPEIRDTLHKFDWVCLKVDTVNEAIWRQLNKAHGQLKLATILEGIEQFAKTYQGTLATDTMLVKNLNVDEESARGIAHFLGKINPSKAYLLVPTRPPADLEVAPPSPLEVNRFYQIVSATIPQVECIMGNEGNAFASTGNVEQDVLSITAVQPLREGAVRELLARNQADWQVITQLLQQGQLLETDYQGEKFYIRRFKSAS